MSYLLGTKVMYYRDIAGADSLGPNQADGRKHNWQKRVNSSGADRQNANISDELWGWLRRDALELCGSQAGRSGKALRRAPGAARLLALNIAPCVSTFVPRATFSRFTTMSTMRLILFA